MRRWKNQATIRNIYKLKLFKFRQCDQQYANWWRKREKKEGHHVLRVLDSQTRPFPSHSSSLLLSSPPFVWVVLLPLANIHEACFHLLSQNCIITLLWPPFLLSPLPPLVVSSQFHFLFICSLFSKNSFYLIFSPVLRPSQHDLHLCKTR